MHFLCSEPKASAYKTNALLASLWFERSSLCDSAHWEAPPTCLFPAKIPWIVAVNLNPSGRVWWLNRLLLQTSLTATAPPPPPPPPYLHLPLPSSSFSSSSSSFTFSSFSSSSFYSISDFSSSASSFTFFLLLHLLLHPLHSR